MTEDAIAPSPPRPATDGSTRFRAGELADAAGISVVLLRSYQAKGLLPPPRHEGRVAWYGSRHLERLRRIADLKGRGWTLAAIADELAQRPGAAPSPADPPLRLREVAERSGMPIEMLRSLEASGLVRPRSGPDGPEYSDADVEAVGAVLLLLGSGIPLDRFLEVAAVQLSAAEPLARGAVELYERHVAGPLRAVGAGADRERAALDAMAAAIGRLVGYLVEREVLRRGEVARGPVAP